MKLTEEKKNRLTGCVKVIAFILLLALVTLRISVLLKDKNNYLKYSSFYTEKEPFDVLFFGSSRILNAVYPTELWEDYRITSYNMAQHSENLRLTYWQMKNAFMYNKPKVAVVDVSLFAVGEITDEDYELKSYLHKSVDHMQLSPLKYEMLKDMTDGVDLSEYLFPLTIYHNRWNELEENDIYRYPSTSKGAERRLGLTPMERMDWSNYDKTEIFNPEVIKLDEMVAMCKENGIELVLTCMPTVLACGDPGVCGVMNTLEEYALEHGIAFLNLAKEEDFINYATDFYDSSHLNPSGAGKLTKYLGEYLTEKFNLPAQKQQSTIQDWNNCLAEYKYGKRAELQNIGNTGNIQTYLLLLNDDSFDFRIKLSDLDYAREQAVEALLAELGVTGQDVLGQVQDGRAEIMVYDRESGEELGHAVFQ